MRDELIFYVNGIRQSVKGNLAFQPLSDYLRYELGLTGTKVVCAEGDCGSCTVLLGRKSNRKWRYEAVDSCIQYLYQVDGAQVITVEAVREGGRLHPVQQAMVDQMGSQCGYCTPGFVMAMLALVEQQVPLTREVVQLGLTGNLCRCTGYQQIYDAAMSLDGTRIPRISERFGNKEMERELEEVGITPGLISAKEDPFAREDLSVYLPVTLSDAVEFLSKHPEARIVSGGTDVSVQVNKGNLELGTVLSLYHVEELNFLKVEEGSLTIGAGLSWTVLERYCERKIPEFHKILKVFGSPQIRNAGTLAGNIANASPIADGLPFLFIADAEVELASSKGTRRVPIECFYKGYKQMDRRQDELISCVRLQLPDKEDHFRLYKVSKRHDLDISSFSAGIRICLRDDRVDDSRLAMGGVAPVVLRLIDTENWIRGRIYSLETMKQAGQQAMMEIDPISDVRASRDYRMQLAANVFEKFYYESNYQSFTETD